MIKDRGRSTPDPLPMTPLRPGEAFFIGGPWADRRRSVRLLAALPDPWPVMSDGALGLYDRGSDSGLGAAVYRWRWQPARKGA